MAYKTNVIKTVEGTVLTIPDNDQAKAVLELKGNASQTGTPSPSTPVSVDVVTGNQNIQINAGKNICPTSFSDWEKGHYDTSGKAGDSSYRIRIKRLIPVQPNTTYYFDTFTSDPTYKFIIRTYNQNQTFNTNIGAVNNRTTKTFDANTYYIGISLYNATSEQSTDYEMFETLFENGTIKPLICLNSEADKSYEAYKGKSYEINLGKNLFDKNNANVIDAIINTSTNKIETSSDKKTAYIPILPNTTYTVSKILSSRFIIGTTVDVPANGVDVTNKVSNNNVTKLTITTGATDKYLAVYFYHSTYDTEITPEDIINTIQIEKSVVASSYSAYKTPIELCKIDTYQDRIYENDGKWYIEKQIGKVVLDGSETGWSFAQSSGFYRASKTIQGIYQYTDTSRHIDKILCSHFLPSVNNQIGIAFQYLTQVFFYPTSDITTIDQWKTWLGNNNITLYYVLATPVITEITDEELINQLESIRLLHGLNNIVVSSSNLQGILKLTYYSIENAYVDTVYSEDDRNRARIWFNDVELQDVGRLCEKITKKSRVLEENGKKIFALDGFVSSEVEVILHNVDLDLIQDQVKISIGTLIDEANDTWEDIPLGVFNIQDTPVINDNKITLKLRDNRVKFDFNYNAKPLIDANGGSATKRQILEDICTQAGVENDIPYFEFENDEIGVYDSEITATNYVKYLAEQCGCIATIDRNGKLIFIDLNNLYVWRIPRRILPKPYTLETPYTIQRIVYESGITKYETSQNEDLDTLYLNGANVYINRQEQIDYIYNLLNGFTLDSVVTQKLLGNPEIDAYDIIEVYDDRDVSEPTIFRTLANNVYYFTGKHSQSFSTQIGKEQRKENVKKTVSEGQFRLWATTEINNLNGTVEIQTGRLTSAEEEISQIQNNFDNYATIEAIDNVQTQVNTLQTDTYSKTEVQQIANGTGVDGVKVTAVISTEATFDKDGMHYSKTDAPTSSTINYKGLEVDDNRGNEILYAGYDDDTTSVTYGNSIVRTDNLTVDTYLKCADGKGRMEKYTDENNNVGVGFFLT